MFLILARISVIFFGVLTLSYSFAQNEIFVDGKSFLTIAEAQSAIADNSRVYLSSGIYDGLKISANNVEVIGDDNVIFDTPIEGKAALVVSGSNVLIEKIECFGINVSDGNGACVRQQGKDLTLRNVYFHDSQQGILSSRNTGSLTIEYSRFERLGNSGRAHAIYSNNEELEIRDSIIINSVDQGHEVKSGANKTVIVNSVIGSINTNDSRTIDVSNGGILIVESSVLLQGRKTRNRQLIGFALEGLRDTRENRIQIINSMFILERNGPDEILYSPKGSDFPVSIIRTVIIGEQIIDKDKYSANRFFEKRSDAGLNNDVPTIDTLAAALFLHIQ